MPWQHCDQPLSDDQEFCPACGITKSQWTVEWNVTRTFRVSGRRSPFVRVRAVDDQDAPVAGERFEVTAPDGVTTAGTLDDLGSAKVRADVDGRYLVRFPDRGPGEVVRLSEEGEAGDDAELAVECGRVLDVRLAPAFVLELHHLLDDPSTKDDRVTLRSSDDDGAAYCVTRWLADQEQAEPIDGGYLRVRFPGVPAGALFDCEVDPGEGPDGARGRPYLLFRRARLRGATLDKPPPEPPPQEEGAADEDDEPVEATPAGAPGEDAEDAAAALRALKDRGELDDADGGDADDDDHDHDHDHEGER